MVCENECRDCDSFDKWKIECTEGKNIMVIPFDFELFMNNIKTIDFSKYENDEHHYGKYDNLESLYIIRMKEPYMVNLKEINQKLRHMNIELKTLELNKDFKGIYILVKKVEYEK